MPVEQLGGHRKALAILAVLATEGCTSRDRLMALLWPESNTERARGSLKQSLHLLRNYLGAPDLLLGSTELTLNPECIDSDVQCFRRAMGRGDLLEAVGQYTGAFLNGIHLNSSAELEHWVDAQRSEFGRCHADALERLALAAEARADLEEAVTWWRRLQAVDRFDSRVALRLMGALEACGLRPAALQHARSLEALLREEWDLAPEPAVMELVERLRRQAPTIREPSRPNPKASSTAGPDISPPAEEASPPVEASGREPSQRRSVVAGIGALSVIFLTIGAYLGFPSAPAFRGDPNLLAVAPFDVPDTSLQLWREGLVDILSRDLDGAGPLHTVPQSVALKKWRGRSDRLSAEALGKRTGAGLVAFGNVVRKGADSVTVRVTVLQRATGALLSEIEAAGEEQRMGELTDSLSLEILRILGTGRPIASVRRVSIGSRSFPALKEFLRGEQFFRRGLWDSALAHYDKAVAQDSTFGLALRRMDFVIGWGPATSGEYRSRDEYRRRAAAFSSGLSQRDSLILTADQAQLVAEDAADPDNLVEHTFRALSILQEATRRYPDDPGIWYELGEFHYHRSHSFAGTPGPALQAFEQAITLDPGFAPAYQHAVELALQLGRPDKARRYTRAYLGLEPTDGGAESLRLVAMVFDSGGVSAPLVRRALRTATANTLVRAGRDHFRWWPDAEETAIAVLRELANGGHETAGAPSIVTDSLMWPQYLASALAFRGHLHAAMETNARLLADPGASPLSPLFDPFLDLALFGVIPDSVSRQAFSEALDPNATWGSGALLAAPRHLRGLQWWVSREDSVSLLRFAHRAAEAARDPDSPKTALRARYLGAAATAYLSLVRGDSAQALGLLQAIPDTLCVAEDCFFEKLTMARLLAADGEDRRAAALLDRWGRVGLNTPSSVLAALEIARIAERLGDRAKAAERYRFVVDVWRQADPELQVYVNEARAGLKRQQGG